MYLNDVALTLSALICTRTVHQEVTSLCSRSMGVRATWPATGRSRLQHVANSTGVGGRSMVSPGESAAQTP